MKILHLPTSTGGNSWGLSQAERRLGHTSRVLIADDNPYQYQADIKIPTEFGKKSRIPLLPDMRSAYRLSRTFFKIRNRYDVFHFNFGKTLLDFPRIGLDLLDLPYYPKKSKIFVTYNGCDARQKSRTMARTSMSACHQEGCYGGKCHDYSIESLKRRNIEKFSRYASHIFALNPDLMYLLPREKTSFLPYTIHNWTYEPQQYPESERGEKLTIVHAPSQPVAKGTPYLLQAIEKLKARYPETFDFILIQNLPYHEALRMYQKADLIIDQLLIGWYGAFAVESMSMGKPVAAFIREEDLQFIPDRMADDLHRSVLNVSANTVLEELERILQDPGELTGIGKAGYRYAHTWHDPVKIANDVVSIYES